MTLRSPGPARPLLHAFALVACALPLAPRAAAAQEPVLPSRVEATPIGTLPPLALPMPASRNHNYWAFHVLAARSMNRNGPDLDAVAVGAGIQWRGGSMYGVTVGYSGDCVGGGDCDEHLMAEARGRFNVFTGGPTIGGLFRDPNASTTLGAEMGIGYAPDVAGNVNACTFDIGMPVSVAMYQRVRLVVFAMPTLAWDFHCGGTSEGLGTTWIGSAGVGLQQLGLRGLDLHVGMKKIFRDDAGYLFGVSLSYVLMP